MPFNKEQQASIDAGIDEDILISAGAGSGKTKTLSERVYRIISDPKIGLRPSELLVLTFTNNAAHEMKGRIIRRFLDAGESGEELAAQMQSAHIQTFDSFNQWLVQSYASRLGLSSAISVANESLLAVKEREILDELLEERYANPGDRAALVEILFRLGWKNDKSLKTAILTVYKKINSMIPSKKRDFLEGYEARYLSEAFLEDAYQTFVKDAKDDLTRVLFIASADELLASGAFSEEEILSSHSFWNRDVHTISFEDKAYAEKQKDAILELIDAPDTDAFFELVASFGEKYKGLFPSTTRRPGVDKEEKKRLDIPFKVMKQAYGNKASLIAKLETVASLTEAKARLQEDRPLYLLLLGLVKEFDERVNDYKRSTNTFCFSDISSLALSLLTLPEYEDVAEEVRCRFRYIMIDEYQDTNDAQEVFLESLLKENKNGTRSHLFCVGDAKQAIYAFRNSNVELFRARQSQYLDGKGHRVIAMNKNYRSGKGLLHDLNYIFSHYMTLDHGSIQFDGDMERLQYDDEVNLYRKPYDHFGVERITPAEPVYDLNDWEILTIFNDIKKKVVSGYPVYSRSGTPHVRPCCYSDFVILMRTKKDFAAYQKFFSGMGVPVNNLLSTNLHEVDAILLIESLLSLVSYFLGGKSNDPLHYFASIVRSYAFGYSDEQIYQLLNSREGDPLNKVAKDPTWVAIKSFAEAHREDSFSSLFLDMIDDFGVIRELYRIGQVSDFVSKIESLYMSVVGEENLGEDIDSFLELMRTMNKNDLSFDAKSIVASENAVELMTIHASKGLEQKIVYLPCCQNKLGQGTPSGSRFIFDDTYGMILPEPVPHFDPDAEVPVRKSIYGVPGLLSKKDTGVDSEIDEHVRLFYVALTRAENTVIIVGDPMAIHQEDPNDMLLRCPHAMVLDEEFLQKKAQEGVLTPTLLMEYHEAAKAAKEEPHPPLSSSEVPEILLPLYENLFKEWVVKPLRKNNEDAVDEILLTIFRDYCERIQIKISEAEAGSVFALDELSALTLSIWERVYPFDGERNLDGIKERIKDFFAPLDPDNHDLVDEEETNVPLEGDGMFEVFQGVDPSDDTNVIRALISFAKSIITPEGKDSEDERTKWMRQARIYVPDLSKFFDGKALMREVDFHTDEYKDVHSTAKQEVDPSLVDRFAMPPFVQPEIDETKVEFPARLHLRASKKTFGEEDRSKSEILDRGVYLHRLMELVDFSTMDTSFIPDGKDRAIIDKVLSLQVMQKAKEARTYPEFGYYDPVLCTSGYIDLLYEIDGHYVIVDYKSFHVDDPAYVEQLHTYARNVSRIFGVELEDISMYLLSINGGFLKKVQ